MGNELNMQEGDGSEIKNSVYMYIYSDLDIPSSIPFNWMKVAICIYNCEKEEFEQIDSQ